MPDKFEIEVDAADRVGALGQTGMGKTHLMERLLVQFEGVVIIIIDTKGQIQLPGFEVIKGDEKRAVRGPKVIYRPKGTKPTDRFWYMVWARYGSLKKPRCIVYVDEAAHVTSPNTIPDGLRLLAQAGRGVQIGVWWAGQRAAGVNNWLIEQTDGALFVFRLKGGDDRKKLRSIVGDAVEDTGDLEPYEFHAYYIPEVEGIQSDDGTETYILTIPSDEVSDGSSGNRRSA